MTGNTTTIQDLIVDVGNIIQSLFPIMAGLAMLAFFWGLVKYVLAAGSEEGQKEGKHIIVAGIVALFLIASITGIITWMVEAVGLDGNETIPVPSVENATIEDNG